MFYVMLALRAELRSVERSRARRNRSGDLLDVVALGTVADVVRSIQQSLPGYPRPEAHPRGRHAREA